MDNPWEVDDDDENVEWEDITEEEELERLEEEFLQNVKDGKIGLDFVNALFPGMTLKKYADYYQNQYKYVPEWLSLMLDRYECVILSSES